MESWLRCNYSAISLGGTCPKSIIILKNLIKNKKRFLLQIDCKINQKTFEIFRKKLAF
jgi:deoxyhypusine synthase